uniref:Uncharacterized protein n=1 Tax=Ixodes ricinus TaxID=34613 RepID=A0A147BJ22_IXORI
MRREVDILFIFLIRRLILPSCRHCIRCRRPHFTNIRRSRKRRTFVPSSRKLAARVRKEKRCKLARVRPNLRKGTLFHASPRHKYTEPAQKHTLTSAPHTLWPIYI